MVQDQIENLTRTLEHTSYVTSSLYTESWIRTFRSFLRRNSDYLNLTIDDEASFIEAMKENWLFPGNPFSLDVKFNEDDTRILASRFLIQAVNITDTNHEKEMVRDLRKVCKDSMLNATIFHPYFVFFDQFELVRPTSLQSMIIGAIIMMIISFIFIPNILCSLWVAFSVISIELGVAGYMALWDVNLDSISMINLIMCIGFSVDFTAHICYTYMSSRKKTPSGRVREALHSLGLPIVQGSSSTILGIVALLLAESYIFLVFFKMVFLVIFFGAMHGLFLLPVLLSLFGPGSRQTWNGTDTGSDENIADIESDLKMSPIDKTTFSNSYYLQYPPIGIKTPYGPKGFLGAPYKAYGGVGGVDEKDLGIGTSGEDSSESSSSRSQRRQALEDENTRRRYEEGWRRSSYQNLYTINNSQSQFQPQPDLYGGQQVTALEWRTRLDEDHHHHQQQQQQQKQRRAYDNYGADITEMQRRRNSQVDVLELPGGDHYTPSSSLDERVRRKYRNAVTASVDDSSYRQQLPPPPAAAAKSASTSAKRYHRRRLSEDSTRDYQRWPPVTTNGTMEDRYSRRYSPARPNAAAAAITQDDNAYTSNASYRPHPPVRSSSHHNLFYPAVVGAHHHERPTYQYGDYYK